MREELFSIVYSLYLGLITRVIKGFLLHLLQKKHEVQSSTARLVLNDKKKKMRECGEHVSPLLYSLHKSYSHVVQVVCVLL